MKRKWMAACVAAMAVFMVAGCSGASNSDTNDSTKSDASVSAQDNSSNDTEEKTTISPVSAGIDIENLDNCTVAATFYEGDLYDDEGTQKLRAEIYAYDQYDASDIESMKEGDMINICQKEETVNSLERNDDKSVVIRTGADDEEYTLITDDGKTYYARGESDAKSYYKLGDVTLFVSEDCVLDDSSNPGQESETCGTGYSLESALDATDYNFTQNNTTLTIQDGAVVKITRVYIP